jgi:hypothetical protein
MSACLPIRRSGVGWPSGKYESRANPAGTRITLYERFQCYSKPHVVQASTRHVESWPTPRLLARAICARVRQ